MEKCYTSALGQTDYVEVILGVRQVLHKPKDQEEVLLALLPYPTDSLMCLTSQLVIYTRGLHKSQAILKYMQFIHSSGPVSTLEFLCHMKVILDS